MSARCRLHCEIHETRSRLHGRRGWRGADHWRAAVEHEPVPQHRVGGGVSSSNRLSVSRCLDSRQSFTTRPTLRSSRPVFFSVHLFLPYTVTVASFVRFLFGAIPSLYRVGFRHVAPRLLCNNNKKRSYLVHVVNTRRI